MLSGGVVVQLHKPIQGLRKKVKNSPVAPKGGEIESDAIAG